MVFAISGLMAGVGGIVLAANVRSVAPAQGGGTLLLDAISAAVIGGTSLFGGRGYVRSAVLGSAVIATISNGLYIFGFAPGIIFITTGCILLFAVTLDTLAQLRRRPAYGPLAGGTRDPVRARARAAAHCRRDTAPSAHSLRARGEVDRGLRRVAAGLQIWRARCRQEPPP